MTGQAATDSAAAHPEPVDPESTDPLLVGTRPAATVVLLRDSAAGPEVFLLERVQQMAFAPGMTVFPGGGLDPADLAPDLPWTGPDGDWWSRALQAHPRTAAGLVSAAVRELFEEAGVLLAAPVCTADQPVRADAEPARMDWAAFLTTSGRTIAADLIRPWSRWITPVGRPRRYDTHFFVAALPPGQEARSSSTEAVAGRWFTPAQALVLADAGELTLMRPTRAVLDELRVLPTVAHVLAATVGPFAASAPAPIAVGRRLTAPARIRTNTPLTRTVLAPNPGPMTLEGTNSYLIGPAGSHGIVVVDPGPDDPTHLQTLVDAGPVRLILITHRHADHTAGAAHLHAMTGAPVRAADPAHCLGGEPLRDGETIDVGGVRIEVLATPGHTSDSVCFRLPQDGDRSSVLTGDTILGRGTTVLDHPDGTLTDYLHSLERLIAVGAATVLPAHGPMLPDLADIAREYLNHRRARLSQVEAVVRDRGPEVDAEIVVATVYAGVAPELQGAARKSVHAQLDHLRAVAAGRA